MSLLFKPLWFDSMGAKSVATLVKTPDISIVLDPGIAIMHPSFPATPTQKNEWFKIGKEIIKEACKKADVLTISHYHFDHYFPDDLGIYSGKTIFTKNPNNYINDKQRTRGNEFCKSIIEKYRLTDNDLIFKKQKKDYPNPIDDLPIAISKNFGSYNQRRKEVLGIGKKRFENRVKKWQSYNQIPEIKSDYIKIIFPENKTFKFGGTKLRFTKPLFHGIEYATVGWVFATIIEYNGEKLLHSSDLSGPIIEDYAEIIIKENPKIIFLDGPTTYLFGYILNRINLNRSIENTIKILEETDSELIIYDHHLTREKRFRDRTKKIWNIANQMNKKILTAAEYFGEKPFIETV